MKLLVIKYEGFLDANARKSIVDNLGECIKNGIVILDKSFSHEIVEFDSLELEAANRGYVYKKRSRRDILMSDERLNEMRKRMDTYNREKAHEVVNKIKEAAEE